MSEWQCVIDQNFQDIFYILSGYFGLMRKTNVVLLSSNGSNTSVLFRLFWGGGISTVVDGAY